MISNVRKWCATVNESPMPVTIAMSAATQTGHLGINTRITVGTTELTASSQRRPNFGRRKPPTASSIAGDFEDFRVLEDGRVKSNSGFCLMFEADEGSDILHGRM
jgi:hypothetical protein